MPAAREAIKRRGARGGRSESSKGETCQMGGVNCVRGATFLCLGRWFFGLPKDAAAMKAQTIIEKPIGQLTLIRCSPYQVSSGYSQLILPVVNVARSDCRVTSSGDHPLNLSCFTHQSLERFSDCDERPRSHATLQRLKRGGIGLDDLDPSKGRSGPISDLCFRDIWPASVATGLGWLPEDDPGSQEPAVLV